MNIDIYRMDLDVSIAIILMLQKDGRKTTVDGTRTLLPRIFNHMFKCFLEENCSNPEDFGD